MTKALAVLQVQPGQLDLQVLRLRCKGQQALQAQRGLLVRQVRHLMYKAQQDQPALLDQQAQHLLFKGLQDRQALKATLLLALRGLQALHLL